MIQLQLSAQSRNELLAKFPPVFADVICHHITYVFASVSERDLPKPPTQVLVIGYAISDNVEALVVSIDGKTRRPDGQTFHITHSVDRAAGGKPKMSNDVIRGGYMRIEPIIIGVSDAVIVK